MLKFKSVWFAAPCKTQGPVKWTMVTVLLEAPTWTPRWWTPAAGVLPRCSRKLMSLGLQRGKSRASARSRTAACRSSTGMRLWDAPPTAKPIHMRPRLLGSQRLRRGPTLRTMASGVASGARFVHFSTGVANASSMPALQALPCQKVRHSLRGLVCAQTLLALCLYPPLSSYAACVQLLTSLSARPRPRRGAASPPSPNSLLLCRIRDLRALTARSLPPPFLGHWGCKLRARMPQEACRIVASSFASSPRHTWCRGLEVSRGLHPARCMPITTTLTAYVFDETALASRDIGVDESQPMRLTVADGVTNQRCNAAG